MVDRILALCPGIVLPISPQVAKISPKEVTAGSALAMPEEKLEPRPLAWAQGFYRQRVSFDAFIFQADGLAP